MHKLRFQIKVTTYLHKILRKTKQTKNEKTKIKLNESKTRQKKNIKNTSETKQNKTRVRKKRKFTLPTHPIFLKDFLHAVYLFLYQKPV